MNHAENPTGLEDSLLNLHTSVRKLIRVIQDHSTVIDRKAEILDKLPLLDFYNDDLLRNIESLKKK